MLQNPHVPQLIQQLRLEFPANGVGLGVQLGKLVGELAQRSAHGVVLAVVHRVLEEVALANLMFAMIAIGLVSVKVDLPEKSEMSAR